MSRVRRTWRYVALGLIGGLFATALTWALDLYGDDAARVFITSVAATALVAGLAAAKRGARWRSVGVGVGGALAGVALFWLVLVIVLLVLLAVDGDLEMS